MRPKIILMALALLGSAVCSTPDAQAQTGRQFQAYGPGGTDRQVSGDTLSTGTYRFYTPLITTPNCAIRFFVQSKKIDGTPSYTGFPKTSSDPAAALTPLTAQFFTYTTTYGGTASSADTLKGTVNGDNYNSCYVQMRGDNRAAIDITLSGTQRDIVKVFYTIVPPYNVASTP